jgi:hypothetical protein
MARTARIHYQRVTLSFPSDFIGLLRRKVGVGRMSNFLVEAGKEKLTPVCTDADELVKELREFRRTAVKKTNKSAVELLREDRYGER